MSQQPAAAVCVVVQVAAARSLALLNFPWNFMEGDGSFHGSFHESFHGLPRKKQTVQVVGWWRYFQFARTGTIQRSLLYQVKDCGQRRLFTKEYHNVVLNSTQVQCAATARLFSRIAFVLFCSYHIERKYSER